MRILISRRSTKGSSLPEFVKDNADPDAAQDFAFPEFAADNANPDLAKDKSMRAISYDGMSAGEPESMRAAEHELMRA